VKDVDTFLLRDDKVNAGAALANQQVITDKEAR
jgi:hypothetical protein